MKKIFLSMLAAAALAGCAKDEQAPVTPDLVPIDLNAGVKVVSRAAVSKGDNMTFSIAGWETKTAVDYSTANTWATTASVTADPTASAITWTAPQYYNADKDMNTYILAWYPQATVTAGVATFTNTAADQDVMLANEVSGSKSAPVTAAIAFDHMTTQLSFEIVADASLEAGTKVKSIKIKDAVIPTGFDFTKTGDARVTYAAAAILTVPGITETEITSTAAAVGDQVMIQPIATKTLTLEVETDKGGAMEVTVTSADASFLKGRAYTITLTFKQKSIEPKASVAEWTPSTGSGDVE